MAQVEPPLPDAQERLERLLAAKGINLETELNAFDGEGEPTFPDVDQLLDHAGEGVNDPVDLRAIDQMRKHWRPLTEPRQNMPHFVPDQPQ